MNSPRDWGDDPELTSRYGEEERAFAKRLALGVFAIVLIIGSAIIALKTLGSPEPLLDQARTLIENAQTDEQDQRIAVANDAEALLIQYVQAGGSNRSSADLLRCVVVSWQRRHEEVQQIAASVGLAKCDRRDLLIAAEQLLHTGHSSFAHAIVDALLTYEEREPTVLRLAVETRFQQGRLTEALQFADDLVRIEPEDAETWLTIALIHESRSKWQNIVEPLRKHILFSTSNTDAQRLQLVRYLIKNGQTGEARLEFDRLYSETPGVIDKSPLVKAILLHAENKPADALELLQNGDFATEADHIEALILRGKILLAQSRAEEAVAAFQEALSKDASDHESHYLLGQAYAQLGNTEQAQQHFKRQLELIDLKKEIFQLQMKAEREPKNVAIRLEIAEMYGNIGWPEMQREWLELANAAKKR